MKKRTHNNGVPIEEKESFRWLESLNKTRQATKDSGVRVVTLCDRECDIYEFFELADKIDSPVLVRAGKDRIINKSSRYSEKASESLWSYIQGLPSQGEIKVEIPAREQKKGRIATLKLRFGSFNSPYAKGAAFRLSQSPGAEALQEGSYPLDITPLAILQPRELSLQPRCRSLCVR